MKNLILLIGFNVLELISSILVGVVVRRKEDTIRFQKARDKSFVNNKKCVHLYFGVGSVFFNHTEVTG